MLIITKVTLYVVRCHQMSTRKEIYVMVLKKEPDIIQKESTNDEERERLQVKNVCKVGILYWKNNAEQRELKPLTFIVSQMFG